METLLGIVVLALLFTVAAVCPLSRGACDGCSGECDACAPDPGDETVSAGSYAQRPTRAPVGAPSGTIPNPR
jgi:hypothetical protein